MYKAIYESKKKPPYCSVIEGFRIALNFRVYNFRVPESKEISNSYFPSWQNYPETSCFMRRIKRSVMRIKLE